MQIARRPFRSGEFNYELFILAVSLGGLVMAAGWLMLGLPWPICAFHSLTGHPCATCGATRSALAFFQGHVLRAWQWNPLMSVCYLGLSIFDVYAALALVRAIPRLSITFDPRERRFIRASAATLFFVNWVYLLIANPSL